MIKFRTVILIICLVLAGVDAKAGFAGASALQNGRWVKLQVAKSGMQRLTAAALSQMGFSDIGSVTVWSGGCLPQPALNSDERTDDLVQLPLYKASDGALLFYAAGPDTWKFNTATRQYEYVEHKYSNEAYVFVTDGYPRSGIETLTVPDIEPTLTLDTYDCREHHEQQLINHYKSGSEWYGEKIGADGFSYTVGLPPYAGGDVVGVRTSMCINTTNSAQWAVRLNGNQIATNWVRGTLKVDDYNGVSATTQKRVEVAEMDKCVITLIPGFTDSHDEAWVDYITVWWHTALQMPAKTNQLMFRNNKTVTANAGGVTRFNMQTSDKSVVVWNITDPVAPKMVQTTMGDGQLSFLCYDESKPSEFIAFNPKSTDFPQPTYVGEVRNQNLHATKPVDYLILYHSDFKEAANRLAELHRQHNGLSVETADVDEVYNEFSGGARDAMALRNYIRMLRERGSLKYVLLFGIGSYNNKAYGSKYPYNKIPTYQSTQSLNRTASYPTDDFYAWLDDNESESDTRSLVDVAVGRIPCWTAAQANTYVDKVEHYMTGDIWGTWQQHAVVIADDQDKNEHTRFANYNANDIEELYPNVKVHRVFLEAFQSVQTSTGLAYPLAINEFRDLVINQGCVLLTYVGHGGHNALGAEGFFLEKEIDTFQNLDRLPFWVTATCDFCPFDNTPDNGAASLLFYPYGGAIGLFTTTRLVYGDSNFKVTNPFVKEVLGNNAEGQHRTVGDALVVAKKKASNMVNSLKYFLIGDPAIRLRNDRGLQISTDSVGTERYAEQVTPLKALEKTRITATVKDSEGNIQTDFNGEAYVQLYDKKRTRQTNGVLSPVEEFEDWGGLLYGGAAQVVNGQMEVVVLLPKDMDVSQGYGKLLYSAHSTDGREASGTNEQLLLGGISTTLASDTVGPEVFAYLDHRNFRNGDVVGKAPTLIMEVSDPCGINNSGAGIGHDIQLILDGDRLNAQNLNAFFTYNQGSFTTGVVNFQIVGLSDGEHTATVKVWDNQNNSNTYSFSFTVRSGGKIRFGQISMTPTVVSAWTESDVRLQFTHNAPQEVLDVKVNVYGTSGQQMAQGSVTLSNGTSQSGEIDITACAPAIQHLAPGIYFLNVKVKSASGREGEFSKRFIVQ